MGIDISVLKHLKYCKSYGEYNSTVTLGRQEIHTQTSSILDGKIYGGFCEDMLIDYFGATKVDSIDNSSFENATIIHDMNQIIKNNSDIGKYDTVLDLGTLEHIYNINNSFLNVSKLCNVGGQIIHVLPGDCQCGHGFWQFSPELFFSLYSNKNGYRETEVFSSDVESGEIKKLDAPRDGKRLEIKTYRPIYIMVRTVLSKKNYSHSTVQQSDYEYVWKNMEVVD